MTCERMLTLLARTVTFESREKELGIANYSYDHCFILGHRDCFQRTLSCIDQGLRVTMN